MLQQPIQGPDTDQLGLFRAEVCRITKPGLCFAENRSWGETVATEISLLEWGDPIQRVGGTPNIVQITLTFHIRADRRNWIDLSCS